MDIGGIINSEGGGILYTGYLVEKSEFEMEASALLKMFCGESWATGKAGYLENNVGNKRV